MIIGNPLAATILLGFYAFVFVGIILYFTLKSYNPLALFAFIGCYHLIVMLISRFVLKTRKT